MGKIAFIAPSPEMLVVGREVIAELGMGEKVETFLGGLQDGVDIARQAEADGFDVIVTRGGTAKLILDSEIKIPLIEIPITIQDLAEALFAAQTITGKSNPKIGVLAFSNMIYSIEVFNKVTDIDLTIYPVCSALDFAKEVHRALSMKTDVIIGGIEINRLAASLGVKTVLLVSGKDSFRTAFLQANSVSYARKIEKERLQKFRVLIDYSVQGIIGIDCEKSVEVFNNAAERLLGCKAVAAVGRNIEEICPSLPVGRTLQSGQAGLGELIEFNGRKLVANIVPITIDAHVTGVMITIEDVGQIVAMEATIRKEIYSKGLTAQYRLSDILGSSAKMTEVKRIAEEYAATDATVLIMGASGTGKEMFAQSIHNASSRRQRPFVAVNCGAIPSSILESELFGHVEGAFTGANRKGKAGFFELAHGGTLFLDEIGEMGKLAQTSLLRVIQERRVMRLGDDKYLPVDVRIIAATNKNLAQLVKDGQFREDLYYRINVLPLELPVLKDRAGDAVSIAEYFITTYNRRFFRSVTLSPEAKEYIRVYDWPGNIRQLRNVMERIVVVAKENVISGELMRSMLDIPEEVIIPRTETVHEDISEKARILRVLAENGYNQKETAKCLGIDRSTLYRKLKALRIEVKKICNT